MNQKRTRHCVRVLPLILAVLMCVMLPMPAWAEETESYDQTQPTEAIKTASHEELLTACSALKPLMQGDEVELYQKVNWDAVTGDNALHAVRLSVEAIGEKQRLTPSVQIMEETIRNLTVLENAQKQNYLKNLDQMKEGLEQTPWKDLLEALANDPTAPVSTEGLQTYLTDAALTETAIESFSEVLGSLPDLQLASDRASAAAEYLGDAETADTYEELKQKAQTLLKKVYAFFSLSPEEQQALAGQIRDLSGDVSALYTDITVSSARKANQLQEQSNQMENKIVLLYVALGAGGLAVIISIIAVILTLAKRPEVQEVDMSLLASRKDVEALNNQNRSLSRSFQRQDQKMDEIAAQQNARIDDLENRLQEAQRAAQKVKGEHAVPPMPSKPTLPEPQQVGYLELFYNTYSPENSFLTRCEKSTGYVLYDDSSVLFADPCAGAIGTLAAKKSEGLFYLFRPVVDGVELDAGDCEKYHEYFRMGTVKRRAKVRQNMGGNYVCGEKGAIEMVRM